MRVISYNLRNHRAAGEIPDLVEEHEPDVVCLQEADAAAIPESVGGLRLAEATRGNRLGLAVYYRESAFVVDEVRALAVKKSLHDMVLKPAAERLVGARMREVDSGRSLVVASFHAAPLTAPNSLRRQQIHAAFEELLRLGPGLPSLMVGDFNYPMFKERLGERIREQGFELSLSESRTYTRYRVFRGHFDFATSAGFHIDSVRTLPRGRSDHLPILVTATMRPTHVAVAP